MFMMRYLGILIILFILLPSKSMAQGSANYQGGFKLQPDKSQPDRFIRILAWTQMQINYNDDAGTNVNKTNFLVRRSRLFFLSQISKDFLILSHIGLNNLSAGNMNPTGTGDGSQIFLHDAWAQYNVSEALSLGGGLHYFNGISRLNNQSTLNILTLDNNRASWSTLGLSDQFARHLGVFAKGSLGKFQYQIAINNSINNTLDERTPSTTEATYNGMSNLGSAQSLYNYAGYFTYHILDSESNYLPYKIGSYLGDKEVFTLGAGFFTHPNGSVLAEGGTLQGQDVILFAFDAFYDAPLGEKNAAITLYAVHQNNDYGKNFFLNPYGSGSITYGHAGYLLASKKANIRFQPFLSYSAEQYDAREDNRNIVGMGLNAYFNGHNSKLTIEYKTNSLGNENQDLLSLQAMIYL